MTFSTSNKWKQIRTQFPFFEHHPNLAWLDNAATTQKPQKVIDTIQHFYLKQNTNIHRGIYDLAAQTTAEYEAARQKVADFIGVAAENIVFTAGTTASINLVAQSFLTPQLNPGDEVWITAMEHHANLIPWQMLCAQKKVILKIIPINKKGELDLEWLKIRLSPNVKLLALTHISNTLGTINPIHEIIERAHGQNVPVLIDAAQSVAHYSLDVAALDVDFLVFSGHKMYGPMGIGVLFGKGEHLEKMSPSYFGGGAIESVDFETTTFAKAPKKFEPGTPNIAGAIGLGAAIDFLQTFKKNEIAEYLNTLNEYARAKLLKIKGLKIIGTASKTSATISFILEMVHPHDIATFLAAENIAVRAGHHCTQPLMDFYEIPGTTRISFGIYNTFEEVDRLVEVVKEVSNFFTT